MKAVMLHVRLCNYVSLHLDKKEQHLIVLVRRENQELEMGLGVAEMSGRNGECLRIIVEGTDIDRLSVVETEGETYTWGKCGR